MLVKEFLAGAQVGFSGHQFQGTEFSKVRTEGSTSGINLRLKSQAFLGKGVWKYGDQSG